MLFGIVFALNSSVHSYLVLAYSEAGSRVAERGLLLHGERVRPAARHACCPACCISSAGVSASLWGAVVLAAAAGVGAMFLPPVTTDVGWAGAKGDD